MTFAVDEMRRPPVPVRRRACFAFLLALPFLLFPCTTSAQTTGSIIGKVVDAATGDPLSGADVHVESTAFRTVTDTGGRFILAGLPAGERSLRVEHIGYRPVVLEGVLVRAASPVEVVVRMETAPVALPGVAAEVQRVRMESDVSSSHIVVLGREIRTLPVDRVSELIELAPGVTNGHFRGGRVGQEVHVVDGLELKNQLDGSTQGFGLELSPSSIQLLEVTTGGFGAEHGSALSGVVRYVTRRGSTERWNGRASLVTDEWAPGGLSRGFTGLSASAGGPLGFLGDGATLFVDVLAQGMRDADPRARGLTCLTAEDANEDLAARIDALDPALRCPYTADMLPHQAGDKAIGFARFDRPFGPVNATVSLLHNRFQRELYTPEFRYSDQQLGQRTSGTLASLALDWTHQGEGRAFRAVGRLGFVRLDRYLGALDVGALGGRNTVGGFGLSDFEFLGEAFARSSIEDQLASGMAVPGYAQPHGSSGSPFGAAAEGLFFTEGTPHIANWARSDMFTADVEGELLNRAGVFRTGASIKLYAIENYERVLAHLPGSAPNYARFYPATLSGFADIDITGTDAFSLSAGIRVESFRSGMSFRADRADFLSPVIDPDWRVSVMPRFGLSVPLTGAGTRTMLRFNFGYVAQPPDFRYFLDTTIGDSLRTDIRRQGNPALSFERGKSYEAGISHSFNTHVSAGIVAFRKELADLATGSLALTNTGEAIFSTSDFGTVNGLELKVRGQWLRFGVFAGYGLQKAVGVTSGTESDSVVVGDRAVIERPLAFDQRHAIDVAVEYGRATGSTESDWFLSLVGRARSGYPIDRRAAAGEVPSVGSSYLPWTSSIDLRVGRDLGALPGCGDCRWGLLFDGRNLLGRENIIALRRNTAGLAPSLEEVMREVDAVPPPATPIPRESPLYSAVVDRDDDGLISAQEFRDGRLAAVLDRYDPSLFFGEPRQVRLGIEVTF